MVLAEKKIEVELIEERFWEERSEFRRLNPAGKVPVLKVDDFILSESNAICEYLEEKHPNPPLLPRTPEERAEVRRLVSWFDDKFYRDVTVNLLGERMMKRITGVGYPESTNVKEGSRQIKMHLDYMSWLLDRRRWLGGNMLSLADFSAAAQLSCLDYISDVDWDRSPLVKDWYATIKSRPAFRSLLSDQLSGFPQPPHYANLDF
ncbi:glutathione S-transferase [Amylibacter ulvae]|uniref:Glutathione S-transferase n=1 Tax=Paramylibacter ulvae TaxID=1651968 RepID=A0ABQ3D0G3_9RHOB|nr:glutathione S-transferase [Amylibacter ulvae]